MKTIIVLAIIIAVLLVRSAIETDRCNDRGGVYVAYQCFKAERIDL